MTSLFVKPLFSFLLLLAFNATTIAQTECGLTQAPRLFNLHLGMTPEQVQMVVGRGLKIKIKKKGERIFFQNFIENSAPVSLQGVRALYLRFFDLKLYQIEIFYEERNDWATLESFTNALSVQTGFSPSFWHEEKGRAVIDCSEFTVVADKILNSHIEITDENIRKKVEAIREKN